MYTGLYKYGTAAARRKVAVSLRDLRKILSEAENATTSSIPELLASKATPHIDSLLNPAAGGRGAAVLLPGAAGAGAGAVAGGEDHRLEGALIGSSLGAAGGLTGRALGRSATAKLRTNAIEDGLRGALNKSDQELIPALQELAHDSDSMFDFAKAVPNLLRDSAKRVITSKEVLHGLPSAATRSRTADLAGKGVGATLGGVSGIAGGSMLAQAYGDAKRQHKARRRAGDADGDGIAYEGTSDQTALTDLESLRGS